MARHKNKPQRQGMTITLTPEMHTWLSNMAQQNNLPVSWLAEEIFAAVRAQARANGGRLTLDVPTSVHPNPQPQTKG